MSEIQYRFAEDENGNKIDICNVSKEMQKNNKFFCLSCHEPMSAVIDTGYKQKFFRHKATCECTKETYLHILAKTILKQRYEKSSTFPVTLKRWHSCDLLDNCPSNNADESLCCKVSVETFDLKKYYNKCILEKQDKESGMIPDLMLLNESEQKSLWLEILVTHSCTQNKLNKNNPIIEFKIECEEDALSLSEIPVIESDKISFLNFRRESYTDVSMSRNTGSDDLQVELWDNGFLKDKIISCRENRQIKSPQAIASILVRNTNFWIYNAKRLFAAYGIGNFKHCSWCKFKRESYYGGPICVCYKKLRIPKEPNNNEAYYCPIYLPVFEDRTSSLLLKEGLTLPEVQVKMKDKPKSPDKPTYSEAELNYNRYNLSSEFPKVEDWELGIAPCLVPYCLYNHNGIQNRPPTAWDTKVLEIEKEWAQYNSKEYIDKIIGFEDEYLIKNSLKEHLKNQYLGRGIGTESDFETWYIKFYH